MAGRADQTGFTGAPVPLLDRLRSQDPADAGQDDLVSADGVHLTLAGLYASVEQELVRLLSTRAPVGVPLLATLPRSVVDYGIPDFGTLTETSDANRDRLRDAIRDAITAYEPRLSGVTVRLEPFSGNHQEGSFLRHARWDFRWQAVIDGELVAGPRRVAARFIAPVRPGSPRMGAS